MVLKKYCIVFFALLLVACGFHPRGVMIDGNAGKFSSIIGLKFFIKDNNFSNYANELRKSLISYKAQVVTDDKDADYIINLQNVAKTSQLTSVVGGTTNNTYQLILTVAYNIVRPDVEKPIIPNKTLEAKQFWQSNSAVVLSQSNEANRQYDYLQTQLINNMLVQIAILLPNKGVVTDNKSLITNKSTKKIKPTESSGSAINTTNDSSTKDNSKS